MSDGEQADAARTQPTLHAEEFESATSESGSTELWRLTPIAQTDVAPNPEDPDAIRVAINPSVLEHIAIGDSLTLKLPLEVEATFLVEASKSRIPMTLASYHGSFSDSDPSAFGVITVGESLLLGTFLTAHGSYELKGDKSFAWIYRTEPGFEHTTQDVDIVLPPRDALEPTPPTPSATRAGPP